MRFLLISIALAGCGKGPSSFTDAKRVPQPVSVGGVSYTVDIPDGLPKSKREPGDWSDATVEHDGDPKVFTSVYPLDMPTALEDGKKEAALDDKGTFLRAEQRPDGWAVTVASADKHHLEASTLKKIGSAIVHCTAVQGSEGELPNYDKTRAMLEAICDSVKGSAK